MTSSPKSARAAVLALFVGWRSAPAAPPPAEIHVLLGVDPADASGDVLLSASLAPAQSLTRATGSRTTIAQTSTMAEVMRASRTVENEIIIAPAHVTASAVLHAYQLLATSGQEQTYALVARNDIDKVEKLAGKRLYLPQQDSLRSYMAKGLLTESGLKLGQFSKVTYGNTSGGGLVALVVRHGRRHRRRRDAGQGMDRPASRPGAHPEDDAAGAGRHEHGRAQGLLRHRMRPPRRLGQFARRRDPGRRPLPHGVGRRGAAVHLRRLARHHDAGSDQRRHPGQRRAGRRARPSRARRSSTPARRRNTTTSTCAARSSRPTSRRA